MLSLQNIYHARNRIQSHVVRTPLVACPSLSSKNRQVRFKLETTQDTGAFKLRGATNAILSLDPSALEAGVVCASTGNHGRAVATAAARVGAKATICMSNLVPQNKVQAIKALGADVRIIGKSQDEAQVEVRRLVKEEGMSEIPPFDHADVIAGQGTVGLELMEDWSDIDTVLVPVSGGGLIAGVALAVKSVNFNIKVIGISMERGAAMDASLQRGRPVEVPEEPSLADSLGGGIGLQNEYTLGVVQELVDEVILLKEEQIASGMQFLYREHGMVVEGAGAVGIPVVQENLSQRLGENIAVVVSGRNVDLKMFQSVLDGELPFGA